MVSDFYSHHQSVTESVSKLVRQGGRSVLCSSRIATWRVCSCCCCLGAHLTITVVKEEEGDEKD